MAALLQDVRFAVRTFLRTRQPCRHTQLTLLVAVDGPVDGVIQSIKAQAWALDPTLPVDEVQTVEAALAASTSRPRLNIASRCLDAGPSSDARGSDRGAQSGVKR